MTIQTENLTRIARQYARAIERGDATRAAQSFRDWTDAGGLSGWDCACRPMYLHRDGHTDASPLAAIDSWI